jgi:hypothetical protein
MSHLDKRTRPRGKGEGGRQAGRREKGEAGRREEWEQKTTNNL